MKISVKSHEKSLSMYLKTWEKAKLEFLLTTNLPTGGVPCLKFVFFLTILIESMHLTAVNRGVIIVFFKVKDPSDCGIMNETYLVYITLKFSIKKLFGDES